MKNGQHASKHPARPGLKKNLNEVLTGGSGACRLSAMKNETNNTPKPASRTILQGIKECDEIIAKESGRIAELRPANVQAILNHTIALRSKLQSMLA